jgi:hypothetical protein
MDDVPGVEGLLAQIHSLPDAQNGVDCSTANMGTATAPTIVYASQCNLNQDGYGVLVVTGQLNFSSTATYHGLVLMLGTGDFFQTSASNSRIDGAIVVAQTRDRMTGVQLGMFGTPHFTFTAKGTAASPNVQYNSCWVSKAAGMIWPTYERVLGTREPFQY